MARDGVTFTGTLLERGRHGATDVLHQRAARLIRTASAAHPGVFGTNTLLTADWPPQPRMSNRHRLQQRARVRVRRAHAPPARWTPLDNLAQVHDRDLVRQMTDRRDVVRDEQVRQTAAVLEIQQEIQDLRLDRDVQR